MSIETLDDWNDRLGQCGCCEMPVCPEPIIVCQSVSATANACGGSPPSGWTSTCSAPIAEPAGDPTDPLPAIYRAKKTTSEEWEGSWGYWEVKSESFSGAEGIIANGQHFTLVATTAGGEFSQIVNTEYTSRWIDEDDDGDFIFDGTTSTTSTSDNPYYQPLWDEPGLPPNVCTATTRKYYDFYGEKNEGTQPAAPSFPIPYDQEVEIIEWAINAKYSSGSFLTLSDPITKDELLADAIADLPEEWTSPGSSCAAKLETTWPEIQDMYVAGDPDPVWPDCEYGSFPIPASATATARKVRFRFRIPDTHTGSYFKITYDIAEFPDDGEPSLVSEDNVVEWTGPGTGASSDPSWLTDWVVIDPPEVSGERRVVNVRYTCYSGAKYGVKPQIMGEAFP
jgi:hypothetical protein